MQYPNELIFSVPNGGKRNVVTASILKAEGALAGVPDLFIALEGKPLFIEMKYGKGKLTDSQKLVRDKLIGKGYYVETCYSFDEFVGIVKKYMAA